jgi:hypothetical protein
MKKRKKSYLKEFFGLFGKKKKPKDLQYVIDNDPQLKKIDNEITKLHQTYGELDPEFKKILKKYGAL